MKRAVKLVDSDPIIREHLGDAYGKLGRIDEALQAYRRSLELGSENEAEIKRKMEELDGAGD